jgi:hypothetical protein
MSSLILVAGILLVAGLAVAELRPAWRLPALAIALLAVPGNVDNLMPAMQLDPHAIANNTAPAISVIDLLLAWAVALTLRERRGDVTHRFRPFLIGAGTLAGIGVVISVVAVTRGVEPAAALRGVLLLMRLGALLFLASRLVVEIGDGSLLAVGICIGAVALLGNGIYWTVTQHLDRFTATTFGSNGLANGLVAVSIVATGLALRTWNAAHRSRAASAEAIAFALIAVATLFAATTTGTRMALVALAAAGIAAGMVSAFWKSRQETLRAAAIAGAAIVVIVAAAVTFSSAARAVSITSPEGDVSIITKLQTAATHTPSVKPTPTSSVKPTPTSSVKPTPTSSVKPTPTPTKPTPTPTKPTQPGTSELRSRLAFWSAALRMVSEQPLTGVGPYQWNIHRYAYADKPILVADPHNAYVQLGAEFGIPALLAFAALLGLALFRLILAPFALAVRHRSLPIPGPAVGFAAAAAALAVADLTNSNLFNVRIGAFDWLLIAAGLAITLRGWPSVSPPPGPAEST